MGLVPRARRDGGLDRADFGEAALRQKVEWVRAAAGDRLETLELHALIQAVVVSDRRESNRHFRKPTVPPELLLESPYVLRVARSARR